MSTATLNSILVSLLNNYLTVDFALTPCGREAGGASSSIIYALPVCVCGPLGVCFRGNFWAVLGLPAFKTVPL